MNYQYFTAFDMKYAWWATHLASSIFKNSPDSNFTAFLIAKKSEEDSEEVEGTIEIIQQANPNCRVELTIIKDDKTVIKDLVPVTVTDVSYIPANVHAVQWYDSKGEVEYNDGTDATHVQIARDVTSFLAWTAEPELEERKSLGVKTLFFLILLTIMLLGVQRKVWKDVN